MFVRTWIHVTSRHRKKWNLLLYIIQNSVSKNLTLVTFYASHLYGIKNQQGKNDLTEKKFDLIWKVIPNLSFVTLAIDVKANQIHVTTSQVKSAIESNPVVIKTNQLFGLHFFVCCCCCCRCCCCICDVVFAACPNQLNTSLARRMFLFAIKLLQTLVSSYSELLALPSLILHSGLTLLNLFKHPLLYLVSPFHSLLI